MRNLDDQQMDELFRESLEPDYKEFDEGAWEEMEQKLNGIKPKKAKFSYSRFLNYGAMVALLAVSTVGFLQSNKQQKAIDELSTELDELKKVNVVKTAEPIMEEPEPAVLHEAPVSVKTEAVSEVVEEKGVIETAPVKVEPKEVEVADNKPEQNDDSDPLLAEGKGDTDFPGAEDVKTTTQAKYYILVDGEFVPVRDIDHPGADEGE